MADLYDDNFDDGNLDGWTTSGSPAVSTEQFWTAGYSVKCSSADNNFYQTFTARDDVYVRCYFRAAGYGTSQTQFLYPQHSGGGLGVLYLNAAGVLNFWNDIAAGNYGSDPSKTLSLNTWYLVELYIKIGAGTGILTVKVDGTTHISQTSINLGANQVDRVKYGLFFTGGGSPDVYLDNVGADTSNWLGAVSQAEAFIQTPTTRLVRAFTSRIRSIKVRKGKIVSTDPYEDYD